MEFDVCKELLFPTCCSDCGFGNGVRGGSRSEAKQRLDNRAKSSRPKKHHVNSTYSQLNDELKGVSRGMEDLLRATNASKDSDGYHARDLHYMLTQERERRYAVMAELETYVRTLDKLRSRIATVETNAKNLGSELSAVSTEKRNAEESLKMQTVQMEQFSRVNAENTRKLTALEAVLQTLKEENKQLLAHNQELQAQGKKIANYKQSTEQRAEQLENEMHEARMQASIAERRLREQEAQIKSSEEWYNELKAAKERYEREEERNNRLEREVKELNLALDGLRNAHDIERKQLNSRILELKEDNERVRQKSSTQSSAARSEQGPSAANTLYFEASTHDHGDQVTMLKLEHDKAIAELKSDYESEMRHLQKKAHRTEVEVAKMGMLLHSMRDESQAISSFTQSTNDILHTSSRLARSAMLASTVRGQKHGGHAPLATHTEVLELIENEAEPGTHNTTIGQFSSPAGLRMEHLTHPTQEETLHPSKHGGMVPASLDSSAVSSIAASEMDGWAGHSNITRQFEQMAVPQSQHHTHDHNDNALVDAMATGFDKSTNGEGAIELEQLLNSRIEMMNERLREIMSSGGV